MRGRLYQKIIPIALTFTFMFTLIPANFKVLAAKENKPKKERTVVKELVEKRTENSKVFLNSDGTYTASVYEKPIHFKNGDKFEDIDNTLVKEEKADKSGSKYKNKSNKINVTLDENIDSESPIAVELDKYKVEMKPVKEDVKKEKKLKEVKKKKTLDDGKTVEEDSIASIEYENIYEDAVVKYTPTNSGLKEEIILNSYKGKNSFEFILTLKNLIPQLEDNGSIILKDKETEEEKGYIEKPFMYDSSDKGYFSDDVFMKIESIKDKDNNIDKYKLVVTADEKFLKDKNTVYPVIIDPTTTITGNTVTADAYVQSKYPTANYRNNSEIRAGYDSTTGKVRSYIMFPGLPDIEGGIIVSASFSAYGANSNVADGNNAYVNLHKVLGSWSSGTITWNNAPGFDGNVISQVAVSSPRWYYWDITSLVSEWYKGSAANYGFVIKDSAETARYRRFYSSDGSIKPCLNVTYSPKITTLYYGAYSSGANTGTGYVDLSWPAVEGAAGYKVAVFNGSYYEYYDVGNTTWWTTNGKKIWPHSFESYTLHYDGGGRELLNDPADNYAKSNGGYGNAHNYYFRVTAYNVYGQQSDIGYNCVTPTLPDSTSPNTPSNPGISISYTPGTNQANTWKALVSWSPTSDLPAALASGLNSYKVKLFKSGVYQREASVAPSVNSVTFDNLTDCSSYSVSVQAIDNNGNSSREAVSQGAIQTGDRTRPNTPSTVTLDKPSWTNSSSVNVNWTNLYDNVGLATVQYSIDGSPWVNTGNISANSYHTVYTSSLSEGEHTISIRGVDAQGNDGYAGSVKYYKDTVVPLSLLSYPLNQQTINGIVNVKGTVSDLHFKDWRLEYGVGTNPNSYTLIASGTNAVSNGILSSWNVSSLAENTYTLRLVASDTAGNSKIASMQILKSNSISYSPTLQIDSPTSGSLINVLTKNVNYQRINNGGAAGLKGKLYINNVLIDEETVPGEGLSFNATNYPEGIQNSMYIEAVDTDGNKLYSTTMYISPDGTTSFAQSTHMFTVKLMEEPKNLTATPNINYTTLLRWDYDASSMLLEGTTFNIYRATTENFTPAPSNKIAEGIGTLYWNDYNLNYGQKFYYKVTAVKNINGIRRESITSNTTNATVVSKNELEKRLGLQNYWGFSQFRTGSGQGYINLSTGNLAYQTVDFVFPGSALIQTMRRSYNSQSTTKTPLGYGFDFSFNTNLLKEYDAVGSEIGIILKDGDGSIHRFTKNADGSYSAAKGLYMSLNFNSADGSYKIKRKDNIEYIFDKTMKLTKFTEPNGNFLELSYNARGNVTQVKDSYGNTSILDYDTKDRLKTVTDPAGRSFTYLYDDTTDRLKKMYTLIENNVEYSEEFVYDSNGKIQSIIDPKKNTTAIAYTNEKLTKVTDPINEFYTISYGSLSTSITSNRGKTSIFNYNDSGNITKKIDPLGNSISYEVDENYNVTRMYYMNNVGGVNKELNYYYTYDSNGNILTVKDPLGNITEYKNYNSFNKVGQISSPIGSGSFAVTEYTYDSKGNVKTVKDAESKINSSTYDALGNLTSTTDSFGNTTSYEYDSKGRLVKITEPQGKVTEVLAFDAQNNPTKVKDALGRTIETVYDLLGRQKKIIYADGKYTENEYDLNSNLTHARNRRGFTTVYSYDSIDRIKSITDADSKTHTTSYGYGTDNNVIVTSKDAEGRITKTYYDAAGRVIKEEGGGTFVTYEYDQAGNMVKSKDAEGRETKAVYNELNQGVKTITDPSNLNIVNEFTFDLMGNKLTSKDGEGNISSYQYDKIGRLKKTANTVNGQEIFTSYQYDIKEGSIVYNKSIDALNRETLTYFDSLGRKVKEVKEGTTGDSERQVTRYEYDPKGNLKKLIKPDGNYISYDYDNLDRLEKVTYDSNNYTSFGYDDNGNRVSMRDVKDGKAIDTTYGYDKLDRIIQYVQEGSAVDYQYDGSGNRTKVSYIEGSSTKSIEYNYDTLGRLQSVLLNGKAVSDYSYTPSGKIDYTNSYRSFDTGGTDFIRTKYGYNSAGFTNSIAYLDNNSTKKEEYTLEYDKRGFIKNEAAYTNYDSEKTINKAYNYDEIGRLLSVVNSSENKTTSYTYDKVGNRLTMSEGSDNFSYNYNQFNSLQETKKNGTVDSTFAYDLNGNQTSEVTGSKTTTFGYDKADRLINLTITNESSTKNIENTYNGDGQRIKQIEDGVATKYYYDGDSLLYTADMNNNKGQEHILDPSGTIVASKRFDGNYANMYFFYNYDIRGSVTSIIKPDGSLVKGYDYDEFGKTKDSGDSLFKNDTKFTGAVHDVSSNLYYMNARFYNPNTGRFLTQDTYAGNPYESWTQHLYSYTSNNPINYVDPTGHRAFSVTDEAAGTSVHDTNADDKNNIAVKVKRATKVALISGLRDTSADKLGEYFTEKVPEHVTLGELADNLPNRNAKRSFIFKFGKGVTAETIVPKVGAKSLKMLGKIGIASAVLTIPETIENFTQYKHPLLRTGVNIAAMSLGIAIGAMTATASTPVVITGVIIAFGIGLGADMVNDVFFDQKKR